MKKIKIQILDMHCSACAMNIDFDLEDLDGVKSSDTNFAKQICIVEFDESKIDETKILEQIGITGYHGVLIEK